TFSSMVLCLLLCSVTYKVDLIKGKREKGKTNKQTKGLVWAAAEKANSIPDSAHVPRARSWSSTRASAREGRIVLLRENIEGRELLLLSTVSGMHPCSTVIDIFTLENQIA
uniref:Uncharacterized protein n=1 Tax=Anas platyrhynchos TaxID=8839 RepID=A0A8B9T547_ANAPL